MARIVGLFPAAPAVVDPDLQRGLDERQVLIEQRARELATLAIEHRQPWTAQLGRAPVDPLRREHWLRQLDTVAAYRERWGVAGRTVLGGRGATSLEQEEQHRLAQRAVDAALQVHRTTGPAVSGLRQSLNRQVSREGVEL